MYLRLKRLRTRPELLIPSAALVLGLIVFALVPTLISLSQAKTALQQIQDTVHKALLQPQPTNSAPLGVPTNLTHVHTVNIPATCATPTVDLKVLVIAADGNEVDLPAITSELDYLGAPYTVYYGAKTPNGFTPDLLSDGACHAYYNGVILTTGDLAYNNGTQWLSALSATEWTTLWTYEAQYGVRQVSWYTYPSPDFGFVNAGTAVSTMTTPLQAIYTKAAHAVFPYANTANPLPIQYAYTYLAKPLADKADTPLLTDGNGDALALVHNYTDGRESLALTMDSNPYLTHDLVLAYGLVNWATKGLFIGQRKIYNSPQIDDIFLDDTIWTPTTPCGTSVDATGGDYRITGADFANITAWQDTQNQTTMLHNFRLDMVFNGYGTTAGAYNNDTLTPEAKKDQGEFIWTNHTYDHLNLNTVDYATAVGELKDNYQIASKLHLRDFTTLAMVTPDISGLTNPNFLQAAYDLGLRYVVSDSSQPGYNNPTPNTGIYNPLQPAILMVPRRPTNLFFNVSTPDEWVAEYNCFYQSYWGHALTYQQILDNQSQALLTDMLQGNVDPDMYHQPNLRAYDGTHSLLGDLLDMTFAKYSSLVNLPVESLRLDALGRLMANRMTLNASGAQVSLVGGTTLVLTAKTTVEIPVTGLRSKGSETYGGQHISYITVQPGVPVSLPYHP